MNDCKNCKYTDEYCASGDCNKIQANNLACSKISLTEQWKKGELPEGHYYIKTRSETNIDEYIQWYKDHGIPSEKSFAYFNVTEVLDKVPSYEAWMEKTKSLKVLAEAYCKEKQQNAQLKELLKGCSIANTALIGIMDWLQSSVISEQKEQCKKLFENTQELQKQIDEALK